MTIYYTQKDFDSNGDQYITAFPPVSTLYHLQWKSSYSFTSRNNLDELDTKFHQGFRMTVGSPTTDTLDGAIAHAGLRYTCLQTILTRGYETPNLPNQPCPAGIMAIHHFPASVLTSSRPEVMANDV